MTKRIRLTIEWEGATSEIEYSVGVAKSIEASDPTLLTKVNDIECLTSLGETVPRELTELEDARRCRRVAELVETAENLVEAYYE